MDWQVGTACAGLAGWHTSALRIGEPSAARPVQAPQAHPGQSHEGYFDDRFAVLRRLYGADWLLLAPFPTLKRGANHRCASGAMEIGAPLVDNLDSCDYPAQIIRSETWLLSLR
jgi:hypothetical protein